MELHLALVELYRAALAAIRMESLDKDAQRATLVAGLALGPKHHSAETPPALAEPLHILLAP